MKRTLHRSIGGRLPLLTFVAGFVLIAHHCWRAARQGFDEQEKQLRTVIDQTGAQMAGMAQNLLRKRQPNTLDLLLAYISVAPDLDFGAIITGGDQITHATRRQWIGAGLGESPVATSRPLALEAMNDMVARIERESGNGALVAAFPFWVRPDTRARGVVVLRYSLDRLKKVVWRDVLHESISQTLSLTAGCILFWLMLSQRTDMGRLYRVLNHAHTLLAAPGSRRALEQAGDDLDQFALTFSRAAEEMGETREQLSRLTETIRDVFWYVRVDGSSHRFVSTAYLSIWEKDSGNDLETSRWDWLRTVTAGDRRRALEWLRTLQTSGRVEPIELRLQFPDSRMKWIECRGFAMGAGVGTHVRAVGGLVTDVTERKVVENRLLEVAEEERRRIGLDLHDDVCQRMAAALLKGGILQASLARSGQAQANLAAEVTRDLSESIDVLRGFARGLAPAVIVSDGLATSMEQLADHVERVFGIPCHSTCPPLQKELPLAATNHLYRIARELATNAARHAHPTRITISVRLSRRNLTLEVASDGRPFDGRPGTKSGGMGLHALRKHAEALGGRIKFAPSKNATGGTVVSCEVRLPIV